MDKFRKLSNIPAIQESSIFYPTNFKLLLFLIKAQVYLAFHEKSEEKLLLFFPHYSNVYSNIIPSFCSIVRKFSEDDMGIRGSKVTFYESCFCFEKLQCKI